MASPHPVADQRDAARAVKLAQNFCEATNWEHPNFLDTLAAAYAEASDFDAALKNMKRAIELTGEKGSEEFRQKQQLYENRQPFRDESFHSSE